MREEYNTAIRVAAVNGAVNAMLAIVKMTVGMVACSQALISDGVHSVTDMIGTVIVAIGIVCSNRTPDHKHPYGYERLECVAAVIVSVMIGMTGVGIALSGLASIGRTADETTVKLSAVWVAVLSIVIKEIMFRYTRRYARTTGSSALEADAWHQRADALSSVGSMIGAIGACVGLPMLDSLAAIMIGLLIVKAAVEIFTDAMRKMTDRACDSTLEDAIIEAVTACNGVVTVEELKTRLFGNRVCAEITVAVDQSLYAREAYRIAQAIRVCVTERWDVVKSCSVHIHPM